MNQTVAAYIAGVIDGEGCIRIGKFPTKNKTPHGFQFRIVVEITMCERETIEFIASTTKRRIQTRILPSGKTAYKVVFYNANAYDFLLAITPFLLGKRSQAEAAIQCHKIMPGRGHTLTKDQVVEIERLRKHISWLKTAEALRC